MKTNRDKRTIIISFIGFSLFLLLSKIFFTDVKEALDTFTKDGLASYILTYLIIGIPIFLCTYLINSENIFSALGLSGSISKALIIAFIFSLPMLAGGLMLNGIASDLNWRNLVAGTIVAGFVEELYYRGFFFGMLYKNTRFGFLSAILIGALLFAFAHMYQSQDTMKLVGIFAITFMGAGLYAWLYVEWNYNLWVPIFLHTFMNLAWRLSDMGDTALGGLWPNMLRALTIAFAIIGTILYKKRQDQELAINLRNLIVKS